MKRNPEDYVHKEYVGDMSVGSYGYVHPDSIYINENCIFRMIDINAPIFYLGQDEGVSSLPIKRFAYIQMLEEGVVLHMDASVVDGWYINSEEEELEQMINDQEGLQILNVKFYQEDEEEPELTLEAQIDLLEEQLKKAKVSEDWERAAKLRDEIKERKSRQE